MESIKLHLLPFSVLSVLAAAQSSSVRFANTSSTTISSQTSSGCDRCTVTALEVFHTFPTDVEVTSITSTNVVVPMVTVHPDGSRETNYVTETQKADPTAPGSVSAGPTGVDPYASLTWVVNGVVMTWPTTYVEFYDLSGGTFYPIVPVADPTATCTYDNQPLQLPTNSATGLIVPLPSGLSINPESPTAISAPPAIHSYLDSFPAVSSQFGGTPVAKCAWTKIVPTSLATATAPAFTEAVPVAKVSVSVLTEVTAQQVLITPTPNERVTATPGGETTLAIAHTESQDTILVVPPGSTPTPNNNNPPPVNNNSPAQNQQQGTTAQNTQGLGGIIATLLNPTLIATNGNTGNSGGSGGVNVQAVPSAGASGGNVQTGGAGTGNAQASEAAGINSGSAQASGTAGAATGNVQSGGQGGVANGGGGSSAALPAPLVVVLGGTPTTIAPTVVAAPGSTGSVTAFVLGSGSTLVVGGAPITVSGTAVSAPGATTSGGIGGAIATGLGYTGPVASDSLATSFRGPNVPVGILAGFGGVLGALAVGL